MKVPMEVIRFFSEIEPLLKRVEELSVPVLKDISHKYNGFFEYRVKSHESFTEKIFKGEIKDAFSDCTDIFAGTIVLPSRKVNKSVISEIGEKFVIRDVISNRVSQPTRFDYDDIHLIISIKPERYETEGIIHRFPMEVQIKTLLQYAISKATHDVLYKGDKFSAKRVRLAAQLRATFEMAEGLMEKIDLADQILEFEDDGNYKLREKIIDFIKNHWDPIDWPNDLRRISIIVEKYLQLAGMSFEEFLNVTKENAEIIALRSVGPVISILAVLLTVKNDELIRKARQSKIFFLVPQEAEQLLPILERIPTDLRISLNCK